MEIYNGCKLAFAANLDLIPKSYGSLSPARNNI